MLNGEHDALNQQTGLGVSPSNERIVFRVGLVGCDGVGGGQIESAFRASLTVTGGTVGAQDGHNDDFIDRRRFRL